MDLAGVDVDDYIITEGGIYKYRKKVKRSRPKGPTLDLERPFLVILDILDRFKKHNIPIFKVERSLLKDWIQLYVGCSRASAYRYANFIMELYKRIVI
ncbi:MAG: hypothetical protein DRN29_08270 [Thermoplasmata archaeon]|nr:MAG: hypothetical protein DRN29_08270 [Thermoplasmata archaeon]